MIAYLHGTLAVKNNSGIIIDVDGVGYFVQVSAKSLQALPNVGESVQVYTYLQVKEDSLSLFGFTQMQEKEMFELLISVNGLGPKLALTILSLFAPNQLAQLIVAQDYAGVSKAQGVGKKIAQRICIELKDSFTSPYWQDAGTALNGSGGFVDTSALSSGGSDVIDDANINGVEFKEIQQALRSMGFKDAEITAALDGCPTSASIEEGIRYALMSLGKGVDRKSVV